MTQRLYNDEDRYTEEAAQLSSEFARAIKPVFKKYADEGFSLRDIGSICVSEIQCHTAQEIILRSIEKNKAEKEKGNGQ